MVADLHAYVSANSARLRLAQLATYQLRYLDGMTTSQVAADRGERFSTVARRLWRLRRAARRWLATKSVRLATYIDTRETRTACVPSSDDGGSL